MNELNPYRILPLGDSAITVDFGNTIDEKINRTITGWFHRLQIHPLPGMIEAVPAYSSLTVHYDVAMLRKRVPAGSTVYEWVREQLEKRLAEPAEDEANQERFISIPVCYEEEFAPGIGELAMYHHITPEEVVRIHSSRSYRVYMLGFLPGFAYMGPVDERIRMPRRQQPVTVRAGSVGIAGDQTGIYPLSSPGGWSIIGRTPMRLFDANAKEPVLLQAGDRVRFYSISRHEFENH